MQAEAQNDSSWFWKGLLYCKPEKLSARLCVTRCTKDILSAFWRTMFTPRLPPFDQLLGKVPSLQATSFMFRTLLIQRHANGMKPLSGPSLIIKQAKPYSISTYPKHHLKTKFYGNQTGRANSLPNLTNNSVHFQDTALYKAIEQSSNIKVEKHSYGELHGTHYQ